jgi:hypothetical protein
MIGLIAFAAAAVAVTPADRTAIFRAAGAARRGTGWVICADDPQAQARIDEVRDVNGDGRLDAIVSEDGLFCHGRSETGFVLLSRQTDGRWKRMAGMSGVPLFLKTRGVGGWPDLSVGGPGFCFPVLRWNGHEYVNHRREYEGKPCR